MNNAYWFPYVNHRRKYIMKRTILALILSAVATQAAAVPILQNASFETNNITTTGALAYKNRITLVAAPWTFSGGAGISRDNSDWGGITASGDFFAFFQNTSAITQVFNSDGDYDLDFSFDLADRTNVGTQNQVIEVLLDGTLYSSINATNSWTTFNLMNVAIGAGNHTLEFRGTNPQNAFDTTTFLDNIQMTATARQPQNNVPEPATLGLLGLGLAGLSFTRRRKA